jgi:hypothetical protein
MKKFLLGLALGVTLVAGFLGIVTATIQRNAAKAEREAATAHAAAAEAAAARASTR